jgi:cyclophilin family peptidyl-prolyl cis-trans isomerase
MTSPVPDWAATRVAATANRAVSSNLDLQHGIFALLGCEPLQSRIPPPVPHDADPARIAVTDPPGHQTFAGGQPVTRFLCLFTLLSGVISFACGQTPLLARQQPPEGSLDAFTGSAAIDKQMVFGDERFPNVVVTKSGTVLVTWGSTRVRARRSTDGGRSWGPEIVIAESGIHGGGTLVDETTGDLLAFVEAKHPPAPLSIYRSRDDGQSWQVESDVKLRPDAHGHLPSMHMNEHGITLRHGRHAGRLIRAARYYGRRNDRSEWPRHYTTAIYSDDGGSTWQTSQPFPENGTGEAAVAELSDGTIYYNSRVHWQERPRNTRRRAAFSEDGGHTWQNWQIVDSLPDGQQHRSYGCMGGLVRLPVAGRDILLFSNLDTPRPQRERITVWASFDGGRTWPVKRCVHEGPSAYSSLAAGRPGTVTAGWIYLHFEGGSDGGSQVARFNLSWLLQGERTGDGVVPDDLGPQQDGQNSQDEPGVSAVPDKIREVFQLDEFYAKYLDVGGLPVVGSARVSEPALREAAWIVRQMIGHRPDILQAMANNRTRLAVMAFDEYTSDVPEHRHLTPRVYWDRRARGLGATPSAPAVSCAEENLLGHPGDPYATENICIHEFAHAIHQMGMQDIDPGFDERLQRAWQLAMAAGLWKETYAAVNRMEYWAEGTQSWFDDNRQNDALHNHVDTRAELKAYDPELAALCQQVYGDRPWRYQKPGQRQAADRQHLAAVDFDNLPSFRWRKEPVPDQPRVRIQTAIGDIELELDARAAPQTVTNFLHYVHEGWYSDGAFHRTVRADNQPDDTVRIAVIQAAADKSRQQQFPDPILLERTRDTGLRHVAGSITMAREGPDTARDEFAICLTDQPELDFGGQRNPDGQGFAVFGKVVEGMDVVEKIHQSPAEGQKLVPPIRIQRAIRLN